jgi:hypothetical protein
VHGFEERIVLLFRGGEFDKQSLFHNIEYILQYINILWYP